MSTMKKVVKWTLFIIWMLIIFGFSSQNGPKSQSVSDGVIKNIFNNFVFLFPNGDLLEVLKTFGIIIRKLAHFGEYFILAILTYLCFKDFKLQKHNIITFIFVVLFATFDEIHQLFVDGRSFGVLDILIDSLGGLSAILSIGLIEYFKKQNSQ